MSRIRILVTGANGQLGLELQSASGQFPGSDFRFLSRSEFDLQHPTTIRSILEIEQPTHFINCAAYTAVDKAEAESEIAFAVNGGAVGIIAEACAAFNVKLIHVSTDYVFDGTSSIPYREDDSTGPINTYGRSKLDGEQRCLRGNPDALIIRTSWVYSRYGYNFVKTMLRLLSEKESIRVVNDQVGSPTWAADLAEAILQIIHGEHWVPGIYHYAGAGQTSWYEFARTIATQVHSNCRIHPIPSSKFPTPARRPAFSLLDTGKIESTFGVRAKPLSESLYHCLNQLRP